MTHNVHFDDLWKPVGMGRRYERNARGLARRLRLWFVRKTLWERDNPHATLTTTTYSTPWTSGNALTNYSFACTCHKRPRYSRKSDAATWRRLEEQP